MQLSPQYGQGTCPNRSARAGSMAWLLAWPGACGSDMANAAVCGASPFVPLFRTRWKSHRVACRRRLSLRGERRCDSLCQFVALRMRHRATRAEKLGVLRGRSRILGATRATSVALWFQLWCDSRYEPLIDSFGLPAVSSGAVDLQVFCGLIDWHLVPEHFHERDKFFGVRGIRSRPERPTIFLGP
jgi:hypothetical protein